MVHWTISFASANRSSPTGPAHALRASSLTLTKLRSHRPHHQSPPDARTDRRHLVQHIGRKGDHGAALLGRDVDLVAAAHFKFATLIVAGFAQLQADGQLARLLMGIGRVAAIILVPVEMPAFWSA